VAVACDDNGVASFDLVRHHRANERIFLYAFDLIELNGDDLLARPEGDQWLSDARERWPSRLVTTAEDRLNHLAR
jgi:hypothetical protein